MKAAKAEAVLTLLTCVSFSQILFENYCQNHSETCKEHRDPGLLKWGRALGLQIFIEFPGSLVNNSHSQQSLTSTDLRVQAAGGIVFKVGVTEARFDDRDENLYVLVDRTVSAAFKLQGSQFLCLLWSTSGVLVSTVSAKPLQAMIHLQPQMPDFGLD